MTKEEIKQKLSLLPLEPGCYLMKDVHGTIIYVGKAKKLKNRVSSYFTGVHNYKTTKLVSEIVDFDYIVTDSEKEALLLEINLIKDYSPKYNIMFMDNSYYPYIQLTKETHPRLRIVRDAKDKHCKHFGPFPDATAARETWKLLERLYPLRKCEHLPKKPCLYASLGQCLAPCVNDIDPEIYKDIFQQISKFMQGDTKDILDTLEKQMQEASEALNFERAKECRDLMRYIGHVTSKQHVQFQDQMDRDILGYQVDNGYLSIQLFFMRQGKLLSRSLEIVPIYDEEEDEIVRFILDYYSKNTLPKELLLPTTIDVSVLREVLDCKIVQPEKGNKKELVQMALKNAAEALEKKFALQSKNEEKTTQAMALLAKKLGLEKISRVELFDNSNIQGSYAVAGMVVFIDGMPAKKEYRKFKIQTVVGADDYASMREIIYRRYLRVLAEGLERPDLIIVDGGKGQIKVAQEVLQTLNLPIKVCGLSKDDKHQTAVLVNSDYTEVDIDRKSALFYLLTRMQDEVHRYAITFHQQVRSKSLFDSIIDDVPGIGAKRKKKLLVHFGSVKKMREASVDELSKLVPKEVAERLHQRLHQ